MTGNGNYAGTTSKERLCGNKERGGVIVAEGMMLWGNYQLHATLQMRRGEAACSRRPQPLLMARYRWRAAACALIIHVITIERTHPGRAPWRIHGVRRPSRKPPDQSRNCRPDKQLNPHPVHYSEWRFGWSLRKRIALAIFTCNFSSLFHFVRVRVLILIRGSCDSPDKTFSEERLSIQMTWD